MILALTLALLCLTPQSGIAYFRLNAQTVPHLVLPKTRPALRSNASSTSTNPVLQTFRNDILSLVNQERKKRELASLTRNPFLERSAQAHADDMAKRNFFSHVFPEGTRPEDRIRAVGYFAKPCTPSASEGEPTSGSKGDCAVRVSYGENIAKGQKNTRDVMTAWMNSNVHRENILKRDFKELGLGYADGLWVQNFGGIQISR